MAMEFIASGMEMEEGIMGTLMPAAKVMGIQISMAVVATPGEVAAWLLRRIYTASILPLSLSFFRSFSLSAHRASQTPPLDQCLMLISHPDLIDDHVYSTLLGPIIYRESFLRLYFIYCVVVSCCCR